MVTYPDQVVLEEWARNNKRTLSFTQYGRGVEFDLTKDLEVARAAFKEIFGNRPVLRVTKPLAR